MLEYSRVENSVGRLQTKRKFQLPSSNSIITIFKWVYIRKKTVRTFLDTKVIISMENMILSKMQ